jgi:hypothetical protein
VKIAAVNKKIKDLQRIKRALSKLAAACRGNGPTSNCPILEALENKGVSCARQALACLEIPPCAS